jgi:hypothetical protein
MLHKFDESWRHGGSMILPTRVDRADSSAFPDQQYGP